MKPSHPIRWLFWHATVAGALVVTSALPFVAEHLVKLFESPPGGADDGAWLQGLVDVYRDPVGQSIVGGVGALFLIFGVAGLLWLAGALMVARKSMRHHLFSTTITALSVALGCGLLMAVLSIQKQTNDAFTSGPTGFDAVLAARGSKLQIVLNSVFHLETSTGNLPWNMYTSIKRHPAVKEAIPYAVGDNYRGFRLIGTVPEMFTRHEYTPGERFTFRDDGRVFDPARAEAVVGSFAARKLGLSIGDTLQSYHGLSFDPSQKHDLTFTVVGVLEPTNTPTDRAIWIPLEAYYRMPGHALMGSGEKYVPKPGVAIPDEHKEVSAVMITLKSKQAGFMLDQTINRQGNVATLAWPIAQIMADLFNKIGWVNRVLELVALMVIFVAAGSILASVYNTMNERRREFAILRALGARRRIVFGAIVAEAATIAFLGALFAYAVYAVLLLVTAAIIREQTGVVLEVTRYHPVMIWAPIGVTAVGALAGIVPAIKAYATDVASNITPST